MIYFRFSVHGWSLSSAKINSAILPLVPVFWRRHGYSDDTSMPDPKKTRTRLKLRERIDVLQVLQTGSTSIVAVLRHEAGEQLSGAAEKGWRAAIMSMYKVASSNAAPWCRRKITPAYVWTNAYGSRKLPMVIIGKAENPRCFRKEALEVLYFSTKPVYSSNTVLFCNWFNSVFPTHIRRTTFNLVALLLENASSHNELRDLLGLITVILLPDNVTKVHQPMNAVVIFVFKRMYRKLMLR